MKPFRLAALVGGIAALAVFAGVGLPDSASGDTSPAQPSRTITVTGSGSVTVRPNQAGFSFGVTSQAKSAAQALDANAAAISKVIAALKAGGVGADKIQTENVSISPVTSEQGDAILGYSVSNSVSVTVSDIERSGDLIDAAVAAGANQVSGPSLTVAAEDALYQDALRAAVSDARTKAQALAQASGVQLGDIVSVAEGAGGAPPGPVFSATESKADVPIEPGTREISASVTVVFAVT
jgi:uncharacterized protein